MSKFKKALKYTLYALLIVFIIIQVFRPKRNIQEGVSENDISKKYTVPDSVQQILKVACYDCHSNNTRYPWYANIQPVAWWLDNHIKDGKSEINFSEFSSYSPRKQFKKLKDTKEQLDEGEMPLPSYTIIHKDAILDSAKKNLIIKWVVGIIDQMKATYPADSLKMKRRTQEPPPVK
jgi:hypothetical protein